MVSSLINDVKRNELLEREAIRLKEMVKPKSKKEEIEIEIAYIESKIFNIELDIKNGFSSQSIINKLKMYEKQKKEMGKKLEEYLNKGVIVNEWRRFYW